MRDLGYWNLGIFQIRLRTWILIGSVMGNLECGVQLQGVLGFWVFGLARNWMEDFLGIWGSVVGNRMRDVGSGICRDGFSSGDLQRLGVSV